jgi:hypothetical protein
VWECSEEQSAEVSCAAFLVDAMTLKLEVNARITNECQAQARYRP